MFELIGAVVGVVVYTVVVAVLAVKWAERHPTTVASAETKVAAAQTLVK